jgi:UDP-4-amino-4,6-dideoxy-N-acetyl-beta-L-altrosamine transaminase
MIPYSTQSIAAEDLQAIAEVLQSGWLTQGPAVPRFESEFARIHEVPHAVAVSSATAGLHLGCLALDVKAGSRVWTCPNSFVASANCARYAGASVDFVDIDPRTRNMSVAALEQKLERASREGTLPYVVVPVDFSGLPCDLAEISALARKFGFRILEDASHAVGARYQGASIGSKYADLTVFSFHPVKIITSAEGGMITTQDAGLAERLRRLRTHGITRDESQMSGGSEGPWYYEQIELGFNYRLTDIQAALGSSQLRRMPAFQERRRALAARYDELLAPLPLLLPAVLPDRVSSLHLYVVEIDERRCSVPRRTAYERLRQAGIGVNVHYIPVHLQPYYRRLGFKPGDFPAAEHYYSRALTVPLYPDLSTAQQDEVVEALRRALEA